MAFDQSTISDPKAARTGADLLVSWSSTSPAGTIFQLYIDRQLVWHGTVRSAVVPLPTTGTGGVLSFEIGTVGPTEADTDFSASLPAPWQNRALLNWLGGSYESPTLVGFHVYMGTAPGGAVSYAAPVATVTAYPQDQVLDGFGEGGFGEGGFGEAAGRYSWESDPLAAGVWNFAVKAFDEAGNESITETASCTITAPPNPPAPNAAGLRLVISAYNPSTRVATLTWNASP